ncbi:MAG: DUF6531 domain-containing protein, partial [Gammaproteobacteria bacterium]|nr:DUF6531 domain-containing protein [Gammaproteobacteria bacterium]
MIASHSGWYICGEEYNGTNPDYPVNPLIGRKVAVPYCPTPKGYNITAQNAKPVIEQNAISNFTRHYRSAPGYTCPGSSFDFTVTTTRQLFEYCPYGYDLRISDGTTGPAGFFCKRLAPVEDRCELYTGNPLSIGTGLKHQVEDDYTDNRKGHLKLQRHYVSERWGEPGLFGANWHSSYDRAISWHGDSPALVTVNRENGIKRHFIRQADGGWKSNTDSLETLLETPTGWTYITTEPATESYDVAGQLQSIGYIDGTVLNLTYSGGVLEKVQSSSGEALVFFEDPEDGDTLIDAVSDDTGREWKYFYDINSNLEFVVRPDGTPGDDGDNPVRQYVYEDANFKYALTGIIDERRLRYATFGYTNSQYNRGTAVSSYHGDSVNPVEQVSIKTHDDTYAGDGTIVRTVTNSKGQDTVYTVIDVNGVALPASIAGPGCATCAGGNSTYTYYPGTTNLWEKTTNGITTEFGDYNASGNAGYMIEARGTAEERRTVYTYDPRYFGKKATVTVPSVYSGSNKVTTYTYDDYGNRTSETVSGFQPDGTPVSRTIAWEYNGPLHQLSKIDGPGEDAGDSTVLRYYPDDPGEGNNRARLREIEDANAVLTRRDIQYTATGKVASEQRPNGLSLSYTYYPGNDLLETLTASSDAQSRIIYWSYLATGEVESITTGYSSPAATTLRLGYDAARRLTRITDGLGNYTEYTLDSEGNPVTENIHDSGGALMKAVSLTFDAYNRIDVFSQANESVDYDYAADGTLDRRIDGYGIVTGYRYDALKRLTQTIRNPGGWQTDTADTATAYSYDAADRLTRVLDPVNGTTIYVYDDLGNLFSQSSPDSGLTRFRYDAAGNRIQQTDAKGQVITYTYDASNRMTGLDAPGIDEDVTYRYDGCIKGEGRLCELTVAPASANQLVVDYRYTAFGEVASHQGASYGYDAAGRVQSITYPSGSIVTYTRDLNGQVTRVDLDRDGQVQTLASAIQHAPFGSVTRLTLGNGLSVSKELDQAYRAASTRLDGLLDETYRLDAAGNLAEILDNRVAGHDRAFGYDELGRIRMYDEGEAVSGGGPQPPPPPDGLLFSSPPAFLATIQSLNNEASHPPGVPSKPWLTAAVSGLAAGGVNIALERAEAAPGSVSMTETIGYMAMGNGVAGVFSASDGQPVAYEALISSDSITGWGTCKTVSLSGNYSTPPLIIASPASRDGGDGGWLRRCA